jgi:hypothetical protein
MMVAVYTRRRFRLARFHDCCARNPILRYLQCAEARIQVRQDIQFHTYEILW